jgi:hypothetical protein
VVWSRPGFRDLGAAYPCGFSRLRDIGLKESAVSAGNLSGTNVALQVLKRRLRDVERVWLVGVDHEKPNPTVIGWPRFRLIQVWTIDSISLRLYVRNAVHARHSGVTQVHGARVVAMFHGGPAHPLKIG